MDGSTVSVDYLSQHAPAASDAKPAADRADAGDGPSFHAILSALNPLQYLPVVGTIYRAVTGDTIPEGLRIAGSFAVSALTGGAIGMIVNAATTVAEKLIGIDPEAIAHDVAQSLGLAPPASAATAPAPIKEAGNPAAVGVDLPLPVMLLPLVPSEAQRRAGLASYARFAAA